MQKGKIHGRQGLHSLCTLLILHLLSSLPINVILHQVLHMFHSLKLQMHHAHSILATAVLGSLVACIAWLMRHKVHVRQTFELLKKCYSS